jgi:hypothetical protein
VRGQQIGTHVAEVHPLLTTAKCIKGGTCTNQATSVVPDANWRWLHITTGTTNCYTGNTWNTAECPDLVTCAANCSLDGAAYGSTYSISTSGNALTLDFDTGSNVGSRVYLMDGRNHYEEFMLMNQEFTLMLTFQTFHAASMAHYTSLRCRLMAGWLQTQETRWCQLWNRLLRFTVPSRYKFHQWPGMILSLSVSGDWILC